MILAATIGTYVNAYMTTYALTTLHMGAMASFGIVNVKSLIQMPVALVSGGLSDRLGRKPVMLVSGILLIIAIVPAFRLLVDLHTVATLYSAAIVLSILAGLYGPPIMVTISEALPKSIRSGTAGTVYALATSVFGGSTQFIVAWLIGRTGDPLAPAYYWTGALAIGLVAVALIRETAPRGRIQPGLRNL